MKISKTDNVVIKKRSKNVKVKSGQTSPPEDLTEQELSQNKETIGDIRDDK